MKKVILDTDLGCDSDDIGAVVILNQLYKMKKVLPLLITSVNSNIEPALVIAEINKHYGHDFLIGMNKSYKYGIDNGYAYEISKKYILSHEKEFMCSVDAIKKILEEQEESIELITIGPFTNIGSFIEKCGPELLNQKVNTIYSMAGNFVTNNPEWNITEDIKSFKLVLDNFKNKMIFVPFETGYDVLTARNLLDSDTLMGYGYYVHNKGPRQSWDPITVYYAITHSAEFNLSGSGKVLCSDEGVTTFVEGDGNHYYMLNDFNKKKVEEILEEIMTP